MREEMQQAMRKQEAEAVERERLLQAKLDELQARYNMRFMNEEDEAHDKAQAEEEKLHYAELLKGMEEQQMHREHEMQAAMEEKMRTMSNELNDKMADLLAMMTADRRGPSQERHQRKQGGQSVRGEKGEQAKPKDTAQRQKRAPETPESSDYGEYESSDEGRGKRHDSKERGARRARANTGTDGNPTPAKRGSMGSVLQGFAESQKKKKEDRAQERAGWQEPEAGGGSTTPRDGGYTTADEAGEPAQMYEGSDGVSEGIETTHKNDGA